MKVKRQMSKLLKIRYLHESHSIWRHAKAKENLRMCVFWPKPSLLKVFVHMNNGMTEIRRHDSLDDYTYMLEDNINR